jgi:hypothetical protein
MKGLIETELGKYPANISADPFRENMTEKRKEGKNGGEMGSGRA